MVWVSCSPPSTSCNEACCAVGGHPSVMRSPLGLLAAGAGSRPPPAASRPRPPAAPAGRRLRHRRAALRHRLRELPRPGAWAPRRPEPPRCGRGFRRLHAAHGAHAPRRPTGQSPSKPPAYSDQVQALVAHVGSLGRARRSHRSSRRRRPRRGEIRANCAAATAPPRGRRPQLRRYAPSLHSVGECRSPGPSGGTARCRCSTGRVRRAPNRLAGGLRGLPPDPSRPQGLLLGALRRSWALIWVVGISEVLVFVLDHPPEDHHD
jgi:hypothetical protein